MKIQEKAGKEPNYGDIERKEERNSTVKVTRPGDYLK